MSKSKRPSFADNLQVSTPQQTAINVTPQQQMLAGMFMNVEINKIDFFDKNPRKRHDPEIYAQIKASIRASGVQQPVHITQRPNSDRYVLAQGGNTRLSIVKELYEETGDKRFASLPCIFVEYTNETDIQIAHLIENEQRQEMCFWDKAQAYAEVRDLFQGNVNKEMTQREAVTVFISHGLSVSQGLLSLLFFADSKLKPLGKLAQYLSKPKTALISKTYNDLKKQFKFCKGTEQDFEDWFDLSLAEFAEDSKVQDDLDADDLSTYLTKSFDEYFKVQSSDMLSDDQATDPVSSKNHQETRQTEKTNKSKPKANNDENISFSDAETVVESTDQELYQTVYELLSQVHLEDCFCQSDLFPLGFYVEYPDFDEIQDQYESSNSFVVIDQLHEDAGDILTLLIKVSGQGRLFEDISTNNPVSSLPDSSRFRKSFSNVEYLDLINFRLVGERPLLTDKLITWLSDKNDPMGVLLQKLFSILKSRNK